MSGGALEIMSSVFWCHAACVSHDLGPRWDGRLNNELFFNVGNGWVGVWELPGCPLKRCLDLSRDIMLRRCYVCYTSLRQSSYAGGLLWDVIFMECSYICVWIPFVFSGLAGYEALMISSTGWEIFSTGEARLTQAILSHKVICLQVKVKGKSSDKATSTSSSRADPLS